MSGSGGWIRACGADEVRPGCALAVEVDGAHVAVVRAQGEYFAIEDQCSHAEVPLSDGDVDGTTLECWLHGSRFDLRTGRPTGPPATRPVPVYDVKVEGGDVYISLD